MLQFYQNPINQKHTWTESTQHKCGSLIKYLANENLLQTQILQYSCIMFSYMVSSVLRLKWMYSFDAITFHEETGLWIIPFCLGQKMFSWVRHTSNNSIFNLSFLDTYLSFPLQKLLSIFHKSFSQDFVLK